MSFVCLKGKNKAFRRAGNFLSNSWKYFDFWLEGTTFDPSDSREIMNVKALNSALIDLAEKRIQLNQLDYSDERYDQAEDALHEAEDNFLSEFGDYLENILDDVHEKVCSGTDVLIPTAYLAKNYVRKGETIDGDPLYEVTSREGVLVEADQYPNKTTRLVLIPAPARLILTVNGKAKEIVWQIGKN